MNLAVAQRLSLELTNQSPRLTPWVQKEDLLSDVQREAERVQDVLLQTTDRSSLSPELLRRALELGVWYHFNPFRTSAVRVFDLPPHARVLEIGCGAGVVTRYLAEQGCRVTAVESVPELAQCTRLRCEGLQNVEVVESYLDVVMLDERFDLIVCLDPILVESEFYEPGLELFAMSRKLLKATGSMILAVGNPISHVADARIELTRDHVRGRGATLGSLRDSLVGAGFVQHETFLAFPHHAAPQVLIEPLHSRTGRIPWVTRIRDLFAGSNRGTVQLEKWWKTVHAEYLDSALAPGWLLVAHAQQVHAPLWSGWALAQISMSAEGEGEAAVSVPAGIQHARLTISDGELVPHIASACAPKVVAQEDILDQIAAGEGKVRELSQQHRNLRTKVAQKRLETRETLHSERRVRKHREAELDLVLNHSRAVGAMWGKVKRERDELKDRVHELKARYELSEERLIELAARAHEAELELRSFKGSLLWRVGMIVNRLLRGERRSDASYASDDAVVG